MLPDGHFSVTIHRRGRSSIEAESYQSGTDTAGGKHGKPHQRPREGNVAEIQIARALSLPKGSIVVMDRGYIDYQLFNRWTKEGIHFVTRLKENADFRVWEDRPAKVEENICTIVQNGDQLPEGVLRPLARLQEPEGAGLLPG